MVRFVQLFHPLPDHARWRHAEQYSRDLLQTTEEVDESSSPTPLHVFICRRTHPGHCLGIFHGENPLNCSFNIILFDLVLMILITTMLRLLLKPLKQPRIVSEIIAGIFVGPSVLGQSKKLTEQVLPDNAQFVVANLGAIGFAYFLFVTSVETDFSVLRKVGKKHVYSAVIGVFFPITTVCIVAYCFKSSIHGNLAKPVGIGSVASSVSVTVFPVIYLILKELRLLSSEVGRMAMATAMVSDVMGIILVFAFVAVKHGQHSGADALWFMISVIVLMAFAIIVIRSVLLWVVDRTPEGKPVDRSYVVLILLGVLVMTFFSDMFGLVFLHASLLLGIVMPDGPPLGATMVQRSRTIVMELLMPFTFAILGLNVDVFAMANYGWSNLEPLFAMVIAGYLSKLIAISAVALFFGVPFKESFTLGLMMNLRGLYEATIFLKWLDEGILETPTYTLMLLLTTLMTGTCSALICFIYDPTKQYMTNKRRTIQHTPSGTELSILVGIHDEECVAGLVNLLETSHPTMTSPFAVYAIHLFELVGRAFPVFIDHDKPERPPKYINYKKIHNALKLYQKPRSEYVKLRSYTVATVKRTMHQDICDLALTYKATLILLPFCSKRLDNLAGSEIVRHVYGKQSINSRVLANSPCSIGIFVDKGYHNPIAMQYYHQLFFRRCVVLFLGGADSREALAYADRMASNPEVSLTAIRFLSYNNIGDNEMETKLDDGVVTWFWVKNEGNSRVAYREVVVRNGEETLAAIQALDNDTNELWIVGRKQGINQVLLEGLSKLSENPELGVIGDYVASTDFGSTASVLVVHQQIMRG
ncbi:cation/H(+) antiporter 24 [Populus alba x Populus x berolinensis]|uniref:Cation/H(+) antiporter 24 n=1 Tax=Populus alba x Populus x berolinensis TaxID=444605 RepID=A0AAD6MGE6_9ROSI|nr:cation/H(+) antiporter 24 [Populus alba x Populus x berolinensis]